MQALTSLRDTEKYLKDFDTFGSETKAFFGKFKKVEQLNKETGKLFEQVLGGKGKRSPKDCYEIDEINIESLRR